MPTIAAVLAHHTKLRSLKLSSNSSSVVFLCAFVFFFWSQVVPLLLSKGCMPMSPAEEEIVGMNHVKFAEDLSTAVRAGYASAFGAVRPNNHHFILKRISMLHLLG